MLRHRTGKGDIMREKARFRTLVGFAVAVSLILVAGWAGASNMGFKLNLIHAINTLLQGSGVSFSTVTDNNAPPRGYLVVNLDLTNQNFSPRNSNMGFKLNIVSLPSEGIEVDAEDTAYTLSLTWDAVSGSNVLSLVGK